MQALKTVNTSSSENCSIFAHFSVELCVAFLLVLRTLHLVGMSAGPRSESQLFFSRLGRNRGRVSVVLRSLCGTGLPEPSRRSQAVGASSVVSEAPSDHSEYLPRG